MKTLAKALIQAAAFLELSGEDVVTLDGRVKALEDIAQVLRSAEPEEVHAIREALQEMTAAERASYARLNVLEFYEKFLDGFGLTGDAIPG